MNSGLDLRASATPDTLARGHCVASCSASKAAGQGDAPSSNRPMPMTEFISQFSVIASGIELPPGFPPQRVFYTLDRDKNRILDPGEMNNMRADIIKMIADFKDRSATAKKPAQKEEGRPAESSSRVDPPELNKEQFFKRAAQRSPGEDPHKVFARVDKDKSGSLSSVEMREYYKETAQTQKRKDWMTQLQGQKRNPWTGKKQDPSAAPNHEMLFAVCVASSSMRACVRAFECMSASLRKTADAPVC